MRLWNTRGQIVWEAHSDAWGNLTVHHSRPDIHQPLRLPGQFADPDTGLYCNRFRDYDPGTGRYLTPDPLGLNGGINSYRYTPNPVDFTDPLGLCEQPGIIDAITTLGASACSHTLEALAWLSDATTIPALQNLQTDIQTHLDRLGTQAVTAGNDWAVPLLASAYAASEALLPTSTLDILPVGKVAKVGKLADEVGVPDIKLVAERQQIAESFYREAGFNDGRVADHMRGIDFSHPVDVIIIPKGTEVIQYQIPGAPLGNYFALPGTAGNKLGFYTSGREATSYVSKQDIPVLRSSAADTIDDWSMKEFGWEIETPGGGIQFFDRSKAWKKK